ncbi:hypothetical protein BU15DRAFT_65658 [Melanogaster broomeanus]|nr:hypothetical protein BU15DRAFT_65658 [Melanogaster broomeanus]
MAPRLLTRTSHNFYPRSSYPDHVTPDVIPLLVFPFLSFAAIKVIFGLSLKQNGLQAKINSICDPTFGLASHPFRLPYTNIPVIDANPLSMVAFFQDVMDPPYRPLFVELFVPVAVFSIVPYVEAAREKQSVILRIPAVFGVISQIASLAFSMPLYSLLLVITGTASQRPNPSTTDSKINQANAEALLFMLAVGYVVPTLCMSVYNDPTVTAVWQAFPLFMEFARFAYRLIRPASRYVDSGHRTVMAMFGILFVVSAAAHVAYVWPLLGNWEMFKMMFVPLPVALDPATTSLLEGVVALLKWDFIIGAGSIILATLWMANDVGQFYCIVLWNAVSIRRPWTWGSSRWCADVERGKTQRGQSSEEDSKEDPVTL